MAFIIYSARNGEVERRQLGGILVVGRSPECDVYIHDALASRQHCRLEPARGGWIVVDLNSKNGTRVNGERVPRKPLRDGDILGIGTTTVRFQMGKLASPTRATTAVKVRPADPHDALANTVADFDAAEVAEVARVQLRHNWPTPKPVPPEPEAYAREDLYALMSEIASGSWDSIYAGASIPLVVPPSSAPLLAMDAPRRRPKSPATPLTPVPVVRAHRVERWMRDVAAAIGRQVDWARQWVAPPGMARAR